MIQKDRKDEKNRRNRHLPGLAILFVCEKRKNPVYKKEFGISKGKNGYPGGPIYLFGKDSLKHVIVSVPG